MITSTKAIVLHSLKYGDDKVIVRLLTEACGLQSCIAKTAKSGRAAGGGTRTSRGRLRPQYLQPLTLLDCELDIRPTAQLQHIADARLAAPLTTVPYDARKMALAMFTAEFTLAVCTHEAADANVYRYVESAVRWLDSSKDGFANFHLTLMMRLCRLLGFYPNTDDYEDGAWFDLRSGCFCSACPLHTDRLAPCDAARVRPLLRMDFNTMHLYRLSRHERNQLTDLILTYYRLHVNAFPELKSTAVLQELWS